LSQIGHRAIQRGIADGTFVPGQLYSEVQLADELGISRSPVREALIALASQGLVQMVPQRGFRLRARCPTVAAGDRTLLFRFAPGTDTSIDGPLQHDFWEEVWIVSGSIFDVRLGRLFTAGMYACRPPRMPHGPFRSDAGCVMFVVIRTAH
jgi:DNA-binding transcriptional MocR family regulator